MRTRFVAIFAAVVFALLGLVACGTSASKTSSGALTGRPSTQAHIQILQPTPEEVTGPDVTVSVQLTGAQVVQATTKPEGGTKGHIHVSVDGRVVLMAYQTTQQLPPQSPGQHALRAEFVATDHLPFSNRPIAAVLFCVTHC